MVCYSKYTCKLILQRDFCKAQFAKKVVVNDTFTKFSFRRGIFLNNGLKLERLSDDFSLRKSRKNFVC